MKILIGILVVCLLLGGIYLFLFKVTSTGYEQSSLESNEQHEKATDIVKNIECPINGMSEEFIKKLQDEYSNNVIARKGNGLIVYGFLFECIKDEAGVTSFHEVK